MAILECRGLSLSIDKKLILSDVSFAAEPGLTVIAGENGSGKSVLLRCIASMIESYEGSVLLDGKKIKPNAKSRSLFSYIPTIAKSAVIGETGLEDVLFGIGRRSSGNVSKAIEAMEKCGCGDLKDKRTDVMSTGELRRINIASQLVLDRDVFLFDEPFVGLDYKGSLEFIKILLELKKSNKTIVVVSHDLDRFFKHIDNLVILKSGREVASAEPQSLLSVLEENNIHRPFGNIEDMGWA